METTKIIKLLNDKGIKYTENKDMSEVVSFRAGGESDLYVEPAGEQQLITVLKILKEADCPGYILGNGTNVLVRDGGYRGCIVKLGNSFSRIEVEGENLVCGAGALLSVIARVALNEELTGFEFAAGIPGSFGGAVFMNAGAYGGEMKDVLTSVRLLDRETLEVKEVNADELELGYRHSILQKSGDIALSGNISLKKGKRENISALMKELASKRSEKQPLQYPSAGSFFKRPEGHFAGKLIQDCGLKGMRVGDAQISELHSGFMINTGNATSKDITELMRLVQNAVMDKFGVMLEPEIRMIGED